MDKVLAASLGYMYHQKQISFELKPQSKSPSGLVHKYYMPSQSKQNSDRVWPLKKTLRSSFTQNKGSTLRWQMDEKHQNQTMVCIFPFAIKPCIKCSPCTSQDHHNFSGNVADNMWDRLEIYCSSIFPSSSMSSSRTNPASYICEMGIEVINSLQLHGTFFKKSMFYHHNSSRNIKGK